MNSIEIFRQIISKHIPEYKSSLDQNVLGDINSLFTDNERDISGFRSLDQAKVSSYSLSSDSETIEPTLQQQLQSKEINLNEIIEEFLSDLALEYIKEPEHSDPIIYSLLDDKNEDFFKQIEITELSVKKKRNYSHELKQSKKMKIFELHSIEFIEKKKSNNLLIWRRLKTYNQPVQDMLIIIAMKS
jgi:hypothetical protein